MNGILGQLIAFSVYILAMIGVGIIAYGVWKKTSLSNFSKPNGKIKIEEVTSIAPRRSLMIVRIENERFLLACDIDKTSFIAKLNSDDGTNLKEFETQTDKNILQTLMKGA